MNGPSEHIPALRRVAMFSVHSCPLATLGGRETGGMNVYVRELSRHLSQHGIAVDVYTRRQDPCMPTVTEFDAQARVIHLNAGPPQPYTKHRVLNHLPEFMTQVLDFMSAQDLHYEVIHSHYWLSGWVALHLREQLHAPMVHMSHTLGTPKNSAVQQEWEREPSARIRVEQEVLKSSDGLIAESEATKHYMMRDYAIAPDRIEIIPCGVDPAVFHPQNRDLARRALGLPDAPLLLFVGRLQPLKGIDILLRAASSVRQTHPDVQVLVVGGGVDADDPHETEERQRLQALTDRLGLTSQVHFIHAQPQECLPQYYAAADVFVMPSHYESFGMVVLEAMACGTPVVASRVGGLASTVVHGSTGFLAPVGDAQAFAQAITQILDSPTLWHEMSQASQQRADSFTWPHIMRRTQQLYQQLMRQYMITTGPPGTVTGTASVVSPAPHTIVSALSEPAVS